MLSAYQLNAQATAAAQEKGLVNGQWFKPEIERATLKKLMQRNNHHASRDTALWFALLALAAGLMIYTWQIDSHWFWLCFFIYSALYGGSSDARWHEFGHGTAFKSSHWNTFFYQIAAFMVLRRPTRWRWSHARHHSDTLVRGRDPEIAVPTPPNFLTLCLNLFALRSGLQEFKEVCRNACGYINTEEGSYIPEMEFATVKREARYWLVVYTVVLLCALILQSWLPFFLIGLPSFCGAWLYIFFGLTQHAGLPEDVLDHRKNCRTVRMNPLFRFLYWNMNYHLEHHLFPMIPYHALSRLHLSITTVSPVPYSSTWAAYREIIPALWQQYRRPGFAVQRPIPNPSQH